MPTRADEVIWFEELGRADVALVGGKNASLGEMVCHLGERGVAVPPGFATAAQAFWHFIDSNQLRDVIATTLQDLQAGRTPLPEAGQTIRRSILRGEWPKDTAAAIGGTYKELCRRVGKTDAAVAVRSSATAEDLPDASFAGQQETFLNIRGEAALLDACRRCFASLFTDRAISYRQTKGFDHQKVALSVGVQTIVSGGDKFPHVAGVLGGGKRGQSVQACGFLQAGSRPGECIEWNFMQMSAGWFWRRGCRSAKRRGVLGSTARR